MDMDSGMVRMSSYPLAAATIARPMPVFPLVCSVVVWMGSYGWIISSPLSSDRRGPIYRYLTQTTATDLVGSTSTVFPGAMSPRFSASVIILG